MLLAGIALLCLFVGFQMLYIFIPLFSTVRKDAQRGEVDEEKLSVLVPAFNEETTILQCLEGIVQSKYENYEAIFIVDGATDRTLQVLCEKLMAVKVEKFPVNDLAHAVVNECYQSTLYPQIFVLDKENGGKADALNAGIAYAESEVVITLDADSVLADDALAQMNCCFQNDKVLAAGGMVKISQGFEKVKNHLKPVFNLPGIIRFQIVQYLTDFYLHKITQAKLKSITVISGAFGAFRTKALLEVGGYRKTIGEDLDITLKMHELVCKKYPKHKLTFVPEAICYTECPSSFKDLFSQRIRWQKGFIDCVLHFKSSFFIKFGLSVSMFLLVDSLILGTLNAFLTITLPLIILLTPHYKITFLFLVITLLIALYRSLTMLIVSHRFGHKYSIKHFMKLLLFIPFEIVTYRLLGLLFVTVGTILYVKNREGWNPIKRIGANTVLLMETELATNKKSA